VIEIKNFKQAYDMHKAGTLPFNLLQEQATVALPGVRDETPDSSDVTLEYIEEMIQKGSTIEDNYDQYLGGSVYICETLEDLKEIEGCDLEFAASNDDERWPNMTDMPLEGDACCHIQGEPKFIMFLLCWNNAGGPVYYIPQHLWTDNVIQSVHQTESFWEHCNDHLKEK
jgi:hypothetical protein